MEDKQIIELLFDRSEQALEAISSKYGRLCYKLAGNILNNAQDCEECVNDAYLGVWNSIPPNRPESLMAYLCRIVRNLSLKKFRYNTADKRNSSMEVAMEELEGCLGSSEDVEQQYEEKELSRTINRFIEKLKQTDRVVFIRRYYFADSYEEIARAAGISEKNVSVKLTRIRSRLREYLQSEGYHI
ncbi:MAG: sigma-70 family RNA polymerase sigma factor [Parasporobacterium sp.]|nr:sigma-70 family RNA polymerase sigma factor [Parasporobacterium sp.]